MHPLAIHSRRRCRRMRDEFCGRQEWGCYGWMRKAVHTIVLDDAGCPQSGLLWGDVGDLEFLRFSMRQQQQQQQQWRAVVVERRPGSRTLGQPR